MKVNFSKVEFNNRFGHFEVVSTASPSEQSVWISNCSLSVSDFATCKIDIKSNRLDPFFNKLKRGNQIIFSVAEEANQFITAFSGEISGIQIRYLEDKTEEITIDSQSPFIRLQETYINQELLTNQKGFRKTIKRIMEFGGIWGTVQFDDDVKDDIEIGYIHNFPAFSLLKQICFQRDLVFEINEKQNIMRISNRITSEREKFANMKTISVNDVVSMTINR